MSVDSRTPRTATAGGGPARKAAGAHKAATSSRGRYALSPFAAPRKSQCGTRKTLMAAATAERLAPCGSVLVVVPTTALLTQTIQHWRQAGHAGVALGIPSLKQRHSVISEGALRGYIAVEDDRESDMRAHRRPCHLSAQPTGRDRLLCQSLTAFRRRRPRSRRAPGGAHRGERAHAATRAPFRGLRRLRV
ncbi:DEAD/DEAH box helicase family protein [Streptomyces sp. NPDC047046]|uniref:DEAD/DEAH box helicase family protein n=1 Tax=Streptomyces sp. NPDC047046 TaxID=3155378 RepID=UPI0033DC8F29